MQRTFVCMAKWIKLPSQNWWDIYVQVFWLYLCEMLKRTAFLLLLLYESKKERKIETKTNKRKSTYGVFQWKREKIIYFVELINVLYVQNVPNSRIL